MWSLALLVGVALAFDFMNGFHDGANSISTIVATGALTPRQAVLFAAAFNFIAHGCSSSRWRPPSARGTVDPQFVDHFVIFGALMGCTGLEHHYLVLRHSVVVFARPGGRPGRCHGGQGGRTGAHRGRLWQDPVVHRAFAPGGLLHRWHLDGAGGLDLSQPIRLSGQRGWFRYGQLFAAGLTAWGMAATTRKDHWHHLAVLITAGIATPDDGHAANLGGGACYAPLPGVPTWGLAHRETMGSKITRLTGQWFARAPPWAAPSAWGWLRWAAFRCPPRTPSPVPSWAWARRRT